METTTEYRIEVKTHLPNARWEGYPGVFEKRTEAIAEALKSRKGWAHWRVIEVVTTETVVDASED